MPCHHAVPALQARILRALLLRSGVLLIALLGMSEAQMTLDGSLGPQRTLTGPDYRIGAELGQTRGSNLFHSFGQFNVPTGGSATFTGPPTIANIVSRVTGGQPSAIDGALRSEITGANLFLLNPSGVLFGPNASLNVGGSFHVSTADFLRFADGATFSAHVGEKSTLTVAAPAAFGFLGSAPSPVTIQGSALQVPAGQTISVVGGNLMLVGNGLPSTADTIPTLWAPGGRIHLVSVASPGEVGIDGVASAPDLRMDGFTRLGRIDLSKGAVATVGSGGSRNAGEIEVRGGQLTLSGGSQLDASTQGAGRGGTVTVQAAEALTLTGPSSRITSNTSSDGDAGQIMVKAPLVSLNDGAAIEARARTSSGGNAGTILLEVGTLTLTGERADLAPNINSSTSGAGQGGSVTVRATEAVTLAGPSSRIISNSEAASTGDAGRIVITAPVLRAMGDFAGIRAFAFKEGGPGKGGDILVDVGTLMLSGGAIIGSSTSGAGQGGSVTVRATEAIMREVITPPGRVLPQISGLESTTSGSGKGGDILVEVGRLTLTEGARIDSSSTGAGPGGQVRIKASLVSLQEGAFIHAKGSQGNGGTILLEVGTLTLTGERADRAPNISTEASGAGRGGDITVRATEAVTLTGPSSRIVSNTDGDGDAGQIVITAPVLRAMGNFAGIRTFPFKVGGPGKGGDILVDVGTLMLSGGATIGSSTEGAGQGGSVTVKATEAILREVIPRPGGLPQISGLESTTSGSGKGGDILVEAGRLTLTEGARIDSSSTGAGNAGQVRINATQVQLTEGATIAARSASTGNAGSLALIVRDTLHLQGHSAVTTAASEATGGNIRVTASSAVRLQNSQITATVGGGAGDGGNVTIDPEFILLQGSQITANAVAGHGGRISLTASKALLADPSSAITATSTRGINGEVAIQAPVTNISGAVAPLPQSFAQAAELLRDRCGERLRGGTVSRFVLGGRDGVPLEPGSLLLSPPVQGEQPDPGRIADTVEGQHEASFVHVGGLEMPNTDDLYLRGAHVQVPWLEALDVECARWRWMQRIGGTSVR